MAQSDWTAATLNPWHEESDSSEVINLDSLILAFPERWIFGKDNTGKSLKIYREGGITIRYQKGHPYEKTRFFCHFGV